MFQCNHRYISHQGCVLFTQSHIIIIDVKTPYPKPGSMATQSAQYLGNRNVSLVMDSNYVEDGSSFRLCCYNRSSPEQLISCCDCFSSLPCDWGIMDNANERGHPMCIVNVSQTGFYQFKIYTSNYPCYLDIGDPIFVYAKQDSDNSDLGLILGISIPGSVVILIVIVGATTVYCRTQRRNDIRRGNITVCALLWKVISNFLFCRIPSDF